MGEWYEQIIMGELITIWTCYHDNWDENWKNKIARKLGFWSKTRKNGVAAEGNNEQERAQMRDGALFINTCPHLSGYNRWGVIF